MGDVKNTGAATESPPQITHRPVVTWTSTVTITMARSTWIQKLQRSSQGVASADREELDLFTGPSIGTQASLIEADLESGVDEKKLHRSPVGFEVSGMMVDFRALLENFLRVARGSYLQRPPGYGLLWFADFFYSRKSVEECLRPTIQDLQDEYAEALYAKRPYKARWVRIRGTWSFLCAAGLLAMASVGKQVVKIWKAVG